MPADIEKFIVPGINDVPAFSHAVVVGDQVFISGMLGTADGSATIVEGGVRGETRQALQNLERALAACGCSLERVAKVNVYLVDIEDFAEMNDVYMEFFGVYRPARVTIACNGLALDARMEVDCIAVK